MNQLLIHIERLNLEDPEFRTLIGGAVGADRVRRLQQDFAAHDAWENEGGALAYQYR